MDYGTIGMLLACCATAIWAEWRYQKTLSLEREINCRYQWPEDEEPPQVRQEGNTLQQWRGWVNEDIYARNSAK